MEKSAEIPPAYSDIPQDGAPPYQPPNYGGNPGHYGQGMPYPPSQAGYPPAPPPGYPAHPGMQYAQYAGQPTQQYQYGNVIVTQPVGYNTAMGPPPPDRMHAAIFVTLCCFWPTGILAIMRASEARSALARGDLASAKTNSDSAKSMITISIIVGVIAFTIMAICIGVYVGYIMQNLHDYDD